IRHNNKSNVAKDPIPEAAIVLSVPEGQFDFPALPVAKSDVIIVGQVLDAHAHLSQDKRDVYSEFNVRVDTIFKTTTQISLKEGSQVTIEREGGLVRYPSGKKILYKLSGNGMPCVGARYLFFLSSIRQSNDLSIVTAYELAEKSVQPLDDSKQFEVFRGYDESSFLSTLRESITKDS